MRQKEAARVAFLRVAFAYSTKKLYPGLARPPQPPTPPKRLRRLDRRRRMNPGRLDEEATTDGADNADKT